MEYGYPTFDDAKKACTNDPKCRMFADNNCGTGEKYELCKGLSATIHDNGPSGCDSTIYEKGK